MESVLSLGEPYEHSDGHGFRDLVKCGARERRTMRHIDHQQVAQRQGWKQDGGERKIGPNTRPR